MDETVQLKNIADENKENVATYACLSGVEKKLSYKNSEEYITFDFIVTLPSNILTETDNLKNGIKQSVDCEIEQIRNLKITEIDDGSRNKTTRVNGKIYTDDWELPMLHKRFQKIISDRVLSGNLQKICDLDERPMIRRFWCKTSQQQNKNNNNNDNDKKQKNNLGQLVTTQSLRTLKDDTAIQDPTKVEPIKKPKGKVNESVSISDNNKYHIKDNNNNNDEDDRSDIDDDGSHEDSPHSDSPLNKNSKKNDEGGKGNGNNSSSSSGSKQSEGNQQTMPPRNGDDHCECFCVVL